MKRWAIRIISGETFTSRLFAIVHPRNSTKYMNLAKQSIPEGSSDWIIMDIWDERPTCWPPNVNPPFGRPTPPSYFDFPAGNLF